MVGALRQMAAAPLILLGVWLLWLRANAPPPRRGTQVPADLINYFYPLKEQVAARLASGELPLWNPFACSGIPLLAPLQMAVFYPGTWLSAIVPPEQSIPWVMAAECGLGGLFCGAWLRACGLRELPVTFGALCFVFACMLGQTFWPPEVSTIVWLPWLLLCSEKLLRRWRWRWWIALVMGTALQAVAGFPQYALYTFYLWGPYTAVRCFEVARSAAPDAPAPTRVLVGLAAGVALGVCAAAAQLLPAFELAGQSVRGSAQADAQVEYLRILHLGGLLRNAVDPTPRLRSFDFGAGAGYLGTPTLLLLAAGLVAGVRQPRVWVLATVGLGALLIADGPDGVAAPLYRAYAELPGGSLFRAPERLRFLAFFSSIAIAALGLGEFDRGLGPRARPILIATGLAAAGVVWAGPGAAAWRAVAALVLLTALGLAGRQTALRWATRAALLALVIFDLAHATSPVGSLRAFPSAWSQAYHVGGHRVLDGKQVAKLRDRAGLSRVEIVGNRRTSIHVMPTNGAPPVDGLYRLSCYDALIPASWSQLSRSVRGDSYTGASMANLDPDRHAALYDLASVAFVLDVDWSSPEPPARRRLEFLARGTEIFAESAAPRAPTDQIEARLRQNPDALPRAYTVERFRVLPGPAALGEVARGELDYRREVVLDRDPGLEPGDSQGAALARPARILHYTSERVEIESENPSEGLLVLTDTYYPGWTATVDGVPSEILRANGLYRAVPVGAGRHHVTFEYRPASLRNGGAISVAALVATLAIPGLARLGGRRRSRHNATA